jgi:hypothetical protein
MARRKLTTQHYYPDQPELAARAEQRRALYAELERLSDALGIEVPKAPYWTLDDADAPPWYSLPRAVEQLREQVEGSE